MLFTKPDKLYRIFTKLMDSSRSGKRYWVRYDHKRDCFILQSVSYHVARVLIESN